MHAPSLIDVEVAIRFRDNSSFSIDLSKATKITEKAAAALARHSGDLVLDGIIELSDACAKALTNFQGRTLSLKGLKQIDPDGAAAILFSNDMRKSNELQCMLLELIGAHSS